MESSRRRKKIYFAGAIRGGRDDAALYLEIVEKLGEYGHVLTEHIGNSQLNSSGETEDDKLIHDRDLTWLRESAVRKSGRRISIRCIDGSLHCA